MEARVDLNKLQILNDRICQTIEALNQVRQSVRGAAQLPGVPMSSPYAGIQHTSAPWLQGVSPWALTQPFGHPAVPYGPSPYGASAYGAYPMTAQPSFPQGLAHTSSDPYEQQLMQSRALDPYRVAQTFPFAHSPLF